MFEYGSRLSYDEATRNLRMKINIEAKVRMHIPNYNLQRQYGIIVYKIKKRQIFIETILKSGISFTIPEIVGDSIFRISQPYTKKKILIRLEKLPITFNQVNKHELLNVLLELIRNASCEFKLKEIEFPLLSNNAKGAKGIDLEPIW